MVYSGTMKPKLASLWGCTSSTRPTIRPGTVEELPVATALYRRYGFKLTAEKPSTAFGQPLREQRYDLLLPGAP